MKKTLAILPALAALPGLSRFCAGSGSWHEEGENPFFLTLLNVRLGYTAIIKSVVTRALFALSGPEQRDLNA
jgi:hypothetical protein